MFCFLENFSFLEIITQTSRLFIPYNWGFAEAKVTLKISSSLFHQNFSAEIVREIWQRFPYFVVDGKCWIIGEYWIFSAPQNLNCWLKLIKSLNGLLQEVRVSKNICLNMFGSKEPREILVLWFSNSNFAILSIICSCSSNGRIICSCSNYLKHIFVVAIGG